MLIEAGNLSEVLAASLEEGFAATDPDFLECFEAIRYESRANDQEVLDANLREAFKLVIGVRGEPGIAAQT